VEPGGESFVALEPGRGCLERPVHADESARELPVADHGVRKDDVLREAGLVVAGEIDEVSPVENHQTSGPGLRVDRCAGVCIGWVPGDELARLDQSSFASPARAHRLPSDDAEHVFAARFHRVPRRLSGHQQDAVIVDRAPHPHPLGCHSTRLATARTFKTSGVAARYRRLVAITPHIVVRGADQAARFYRDAFAAEELSRIPTPDGRLMSVQLRIGGGLLHLADEFPELGVLAPPSLGGTPVVLALEVADAEAVFAQAVAAGAAVRQPLQETFWGDLHGQLDDPFGHRWNVGQHLRDVPHDEIVAAAAKAFS
jgi:PhnB protein